MSKSTHTYRFKGITIAVILWELLFWTSFFSLGYYLRQIENFRFENEFALWGLLILPLIALGYLVKIKWKNK